MQWRLIILFQMQPPDMFYKIAVLKNFAIFTERHALEFLFYLLGQKKKKKEILAEVFSWEYFNLNIWNNILEWLLLLLCISAFTWAQFLFPHYQISFWKIYWQNTQHVTTIVVFYKRLLCNYMPSLQKSISNGVLFLIKL